MSSVTFSSSSLTHILVRSEATEAVSQLLARSSSSRGEEGEQSIRSASSAGITPPHKVAALRGDNVGVAMDSRGGGMSASISCSGMAIVLFQYLYIVIDEVLLICQFFLFNSFLFVTVLTKIVFGSHDVIVFRFGDDVLFQKFPDNTDLRFCFVSLRSYFSVSTAMVSVASLLLA
nr:unnamed protein product [Callosobruchus analis]